MMIILSIVTGCSKQYNGQKDDYSMVVTLLILDYLHLLTSNSNLTFS